MKDTFCIVDDILPREKKPARVRQKSDLRRQPATLCPSQIITARKYDAIREDRALKEPPQFLAAYCCSSGPVFQMGNLSAPRLSIGMGVIPRHKNPVQLFITNKQGTSRCSPNCPAPPTLRTPSRVISKSTPSIRDARWLEVSRGNLQSVISREFESLDSVFSRKPGDLRGRARFP